LYTVLVEGDDFNEPIADSARSILDGHIVLSRKLGAMGHYPAIDVLNSISRLASKVAAPTDKESAQAVREAMATYHNSEDLIQLGAYLAGSNPRLDATIRTMPHIQQFLRQVPERTVDLIETGSHLQNLALQLKMERLPEPARKP
jgi:flagellar biosynthesis/type III secretory pathway ATPase